MRTEQRSTGGEEDRLSSEELTALRARLWPERGKSNGQMTVATIAEALSVTPEQVWQELEQIRAERAFTANAVRERPRSQLPLLGLAALLLGSAYGIYKVTPRPLTDAEIEQRLEEARRKRASRPKKIAYPITLALAPPNSPVPGVTIEFRGVLTKTTFLEAKDAAPVTPDQARQNLREAIRIAYERACQAEREAPPPTKPIEPPKNPAMWERPLPPDLLIYNLNGSGGGSIGTIAIRPGAPPKELADIADRFVDSILTQQSQRLGEPLPWEKTHGIQLPPGFRTHITYGKTSSGAGFLPLAVAPVDPATVRRRLELALRDQIRRQMHPPEPPFPNPTPRTTAPNEIVVKIAGPKGEYSAKLPLRPGNGIATAADALRAYESRMRQALDWAEEQIRQVNREAKRKP